MIMEPVKLTTLTDSVRRGGTTELQLNRRAEKKGQPAGAQNDYGNVKDTPENRDLIENAIRALDIFQPHHPNTRFQYQVHEETGTIQVALVNYLTGEVVQEVPSSKLLEYSSRMEELSGLVLEEQA